MRVSNKLISQGYGALALAGLHHDDAEAYLGDIPRPLKPLLGEQYRNLTEKMDEAIARALGDRWTIEDLRAGAIIDADMWALRLEALSLMPSRGEGWSWSAAPWRVLAPLPNEACMSPDEAELEFLRRHRALSALELR